MLFAMLYSFFMIFLDLSQVNWAATYSKVPRIVLVWRDTKERPKLHFILKTWQASGELILGDSLCKPLQG